MNFFFTKKWVGGRSATQEAAARQGVKSLYTDFPPLCALKKTGIQGDESPWQVLEDSVLEVLPFKHAEI